MDIPFDPNLIEEIAARFDLRAPNQQALTDLVQWLATGDVAADNEAVADLATGVGKTYLMSALVEYLAQHGVRNVLVVTPGSTIQRKTIENFDAGSRKYVPGADLIPAVITPENFQTANTGTLLRDQSTVKVFVFNVQQLIAPTAEASRRTRADDENLGGGLYQHLQACGDLFIIADEHHLYSEKAKAFNAAIKDLNPVALIGLTATPTRANEAKVKSHYTLGQAIADGYVKVPVIVYRKDGTKDERTQLRDACSLLHVKEAAYDAYRAATPDADPVKPVLFVVASSIEHADEVGALLAQPDFIGDGAAVLHITSQSSDEALAALADVESATSPIRAIVSVNMLKEGWDVKNIAVIVALRRLASQTLTEQILGRGLRLPFGRRTGVAAVDQVDLVAHDSYADLLRQKDVLAQRLTTTPPIEDIDETGAAPATTTPAETTRPATTPGQTFTATQDPEAATEGDSTDLVVESGDGDVVLQFSETEHRAATSAPTMAMRVEGAPQIVFPRREARLSRVDFELANVSTSAAEAAGRAFRSDIPTFIFRDALEAEHVGDDVRITVRPQDNAEATTQLVAVTRVRDDLIETIRRQPEVPATRESTNGCRRIVTAFLTGAGVTDDTQTAEWGERRRQAAIEGIRALIREAVRNRETRMEHVLVPITLPVEPALIPGNAPDAYNDEFVKKVAFTGWRHSVMPAAEFDAKSTEWELAHLMDRDPAITWWLRLNQSDPAYITLDGSGRYFPDFIALDTDGTHWLIEGKSDANATDPAVLAKRDAAETWARAVQDSDAYPTWRYLFVTEAHLRAAAGSWQALLFEARPE